MGSKGEKTRADIVDCANRLFYERGYEATSFSDIVNDSGLYRGNIYHYFKSKDDILNAVVEQRLNAIHARLTQWETLHPLPKDRLLAFVSMISDYRLKLVEYGCPIGTLNTELGKDRRDLQLAARGLFDLFRDWLTARFVELDRANEAQKLALHLLARAQGISVIGHIYHDQDFIQGEIRQIETWIHQL